jgi:uncharacterized protein with NAD-binding domain and iron-sulfur cluster
VADNDPRIKVAVLGGGCGALSAAYWLTATEALRRRYAVTIYTQGWRLGGKGASGRGECSRIEEHGLHVMLGFYDTVFRVMRSCYERMPHRPDDRFHSWSDAFSPQRRLTLLLQQPGDPARRWDAWNLDFPALPGTPGDAPLALEPATDYMLDALRRVLGWLLEKAFRPLDRRLEDHSWWRVGASRILRARLEEVTALAARQTLDADTGPLLERLERLQTWFGIALKPVLRGGSGSTGEMPAGVRAYGHRFSLLMDLAVAGAIGYLKDVFPYGEGGYARIDGSDFKDWLVRHGADAVSVQSPLVTGLYDLAFAYPDGDSSDPARGNAAAGAMLRLFIRMAFTYKGAPLWKMHGGMGDIMFTPLYRLLCLRGVRFEFFQRVSALRTAQDHVACIELDRQVDLRDGTYEPLERLSFRDGGGAWDCWPARPRWEQIEGGEELARRGIDLEDPWTVQRTGRRTLKAGEDFDLVVLGIPPAAARALTEGTRMPDEWRDMLENAHSVATQSVQLWLTAELAGLGWPHGPTVATGCADPLRSWGEMSHLLPFEDDGAARSCQYLCGTLRAPLTAPPPGAHDPSYLLQVTGKVKQAATAWFGKHTGALWPGAAKPGEQALDPSLVRDEFYRANIAPSELYVQSLAGTVRYRLAPGWRGIRNLYLAGDWTRTSINGGCAEAAFESGLHAACAIAGLRQPPDPD